MVHEYGEAWSVIALQLKGRCCLRWPALQVALQVRRLTERLGRLQPDAQQAHIVQQRFRRWVPALGDQQPEDLGGALGAWQRSLNLPPSQLRNELVSRLEDSIRNIHG